MREEFDKLKNLTIEKFLDGLSSASPNLSGSTVSGLSGALAAALISMVCQLSFGKKDCRVYEDELKRILSESEKLRREFELLTEKDSEAFNEAMNAYKMPHESEKEVAERKLAIETANKKAALVPMDILRRCETLAQLSLAIATKGDVNSISDAGVASVMTYAAAKGASLGLLNNLSTIADEDFVGKLSSEQARVLKSIKSLTEETLQIVENKLY